MVIDKYGADALRLYLINSPVVRAESLRFEEVHSFYLGPWSFLAKHRRLMSPSMH